jgi:hypothetical protein
MSPSLDTRENREFAAEVKFLLNPELAPQILDWARGRLAPDPHGGGGAGDAYRITSLYFDTERFDVFRRRGSYARSKYRLRRYGAGKAVFLERKLKARGMLTKRRTMVELAALGALAEAAPKPGWAGRWFHRRLLARNLQPVCQIRYERTARVAMTQSGPIRLTLDRCLEARPVTVLQFDDAPGTPLSPNHTILELKYLHRPPALFKDLMDEFALNPQPVSKYRLAVSALGLAGDAELTETQYPQPEAALCQNS